MGDGAVGADGAVVVFRVCDGAEVAAVGLDEGGGFGGDAYELVDALGVAFVAGVTGTAAFLRHGAAEGGADHAVAAFDTLGACAAASGGKDGGAFTGWGFFFGRAFGERFDGV